MVARNEDQVRRESGRVRQRRQRQAEQDQTPLFQLKVEAAQALGVWDRVQESGWGALSAAEAGRIGGYITRVMHEREAQAPLASPPPPC